MTLLATLFLILAVGCYAISQLQQHGGLKWMHPMNTLGFWGEHSDERKYKPGTREPKFFLSTTWLVFLTDGYHFMQFWMFNFLSLSVTLFYGWNWWIFGGVMIGVRLANWAARKIFSK